MNTLIELIKEDRSIQFKISIIILSIMLIIVGIMIKDQVHSTLENHRNKQASNLIKEAENYQKTGKVPEAIKKYEQALSSEPKNTQIRSTLGSLYYERKDYKKSIENYTALAIEKPSDTIVYNSLANAYRDSGDNKQAIINYQKSIELGNSDSIANLVTLYNIDGQYDESLALINKELVKNPNNNTLKLLQSSTIHKQQQ